MTITYEVVPGGSPNGITTALKRMRCPKMAWYDERADKSKMKGGGTFCGTLAHAFVEIYTSHDENFDPEDVLFVPKEGYTFPDDFIIQRAEAVRMFEAYRNWFSPALGGTLVSAERAFELELNGVVLTARLDAIYKFEDDNNELQCPPGTYMVDYKFLSRFGDADAQSYAWGAQAAFYQHIARVNGVHLDGAYFVIGVKTKVPRFEVVRAATFSTGAMNELLANMVKKDNQERTFVCKDSYGNCAYMKECLGA